MNQVKNNFKNCKRFPNCSINVCPIDEEANKRNRLPTESCCPFSLRKRGKGQKGIKTLAPYSILEVIPKSNVKLLSKRNQKRWFEVKNKALLNKGRRK